MDAFRQDIKAAFVRQQASFGNVGDTPGRLVQRVLAPAPRRRPLMLQLSGGAATLLVAGAVAVAAIILHGQVHNRPAPQGTSIEEALSAGPAAVITPPSEPAYVWLTGVIVQTSPGSTSGDGRITGTRVAVIDWSGKVRYQFQLPQPTAQVPTGIQTISADGTRVLLDDGTVLDQSGRVVTRISTLTINGQPVQNSARWTPDNRGVCVATSNEPVAPITAPPAKKGQPTTSPTAPPPVTLPGTDHSVTIRLVGLDGRSRTIATVGTDPLPPGPFGDSASMLSCNPSTDLAVVARYHNADTSGSPSSTNMTVSLWAVKFSTGQVLFHSAETRMALGRAFFFGSQNGKLAVEFLWNSKVWGSETDVVLQMPSGHQVPVLDSEPSPDTPAVSADGTRILRRVVTAGGTHTILELVDAADGRIIRQVSLPGIFGATAVAQPGGSAFIIQVDRYIAYVDGNGGITLLHPDVSFSQPDGVGLPEPPGVQG